MPTRTPPPRILPLVYFLAAHASLLLAAAMPAFFPRWIGAFYYHAPMFFAVHLVTLGWILLSVVGAFYIVAPYALRTDFPGRRVDAILCGGAITGAAGVIAHFRLGSYSGVAWSGILLLLTFLLLFVRVVRALARSPGPRDSRVLVGASFANLLLAFLYGTLLAFNRDRSFLPGTQWKSIFGHVHLAGVGFAAMMVAGVGYRLFPMFFPAAPLKGRSPWLVFALLELGVLGQAVTHILGCEKGGLFSLLIAAGLLVFVRDVIRIRRDPRPPPVKLRRPDIGMLHALQALVYLLCAIALGIYLALTPELMPSWVLVYGVLGLLGFLGQIILGMEMRLFPMFVWRPEGPSPHDLPSRPLQWATLGAWSAGVPLLAWGLGADLPPLVRAGGFSLLAAAAASFLNALRTLRRARG